MFRIGTRGSQLALWQAHHIRDRLAEMGIAAELVIIQTRGDRIQNVPFSQIEGKGFFTKELEEAQLDGRVDLAVHSLKDLSTEMPQGLTLAALVGREDPREVLLARPEAIDQARVEAGEILPLVEGAQVGTSAARRQAQVRHLRPDLKLGDLRGNVPTRVRRLREGQHDAILLARAGLLRLALPLEGLVVTPLAVDRFVPAPGQGMLGIQCRDQEPWRERLAALHCDLDGRAVLAERTLLERLEGGCQLPFGVHIGRSGEAWSLAAFLASAADGGDALQIRLTGEDPFELIEAAWDRIRPQRFAV
jgi:hydroxymethylbilane synthase